LNVFVESSCLRNTLLHWCHFLAHLLFVDQTNISFTQVFYLRQIFAFALPICLRIKIEHRLGIIFIFVSLVITNDYVTRFQIRHCLIKYSERKNSVRVDSLLFLDHNEADIYSRVCRELGIESVEPKA
jgi:hypothetical protein